MDRVAEVRAVVAAIPAGRVAPYGEIGQAVGIGPRQAGRAVSLLGGGSFTPTVRRQRAMEARLGACLKRKAFLSVTAASTWRPLGSVVGTDHDG